MNRAFVSSVAGLLFCLALPAQEPAQPPEQGQSQEAPPVVKLAPDIPGVVAGGTEVQMVKDGFETRVIEGPLGMPDGSLIFSERDRGMTWKIDTDDNLSTFVENPDTGQLGLGLDSKGRLIAIQTRPPERMKVAVIYPMGEKAVLADSTMPVFEGEPLGRPNDLVVDQMDGVYFTAPAPSEGQIEAGYSPAEAGVYYIAPGAGPIRIADGIERPNGIQLSLDEKILYVNNSTGAYLLAFDIQPDGTVRNRRNFAYYEGITETETHVNANGLAVDGEGRVYAVTTIGVQVFSPQGQHLGTIPVQEGAENLAFAGPAKKTLYVTGRQTVVKIEMLAQGFDGRAK